MHASLAALTAALVHPMAMTGGLERVRHQAFVLRCFVLISGALAAAPFFLAFRGAPDLALAVVFSLCLLPLGAVALVAKTGRLAAGHIILIACMLCAGATLAAGGEGTAGGTIAWLIAAQTESLLALNRRFLVWTGLASAVILGLLAAEDLVHQSGSRAGGSGVALPVGLALAYAVANAWSALAAGRRLRATGEAEAERARTLAATLDDVVTLCDPDGSVASLDAGCERLLNLPPRDLTGRGLFEHIHVADRPLFLKAVADAVHGADRVTVSFRLRTPVAGRGGPVVVFLWIEMRARRLARETGSAGALLLLRNVTAARAVESELRAAQAAAELAAQSKDHFLANMSHELRTPLNAIIGFSEILGDARLRPADADKQADYARIIRQSGQHLLAVVNSILDMSKLQSGTFSLHPEAFEIGPLVESCCEIVTLKAREGRIEVVRTATGVLEPIVADRLACKQILINLLSNAIKFTPENGHVSVEARPDGTSLLLAVTDTGIGIAAADLARLGSPFFQVKSALDRPYEGTGLGLSVVRGLVGLHGGSISIESEPGRGTGVVVRLPLDCRFAPTGGSSATIETISRRRSPDRSVFPSRDIMVKKIA